MSIQDLLTEISQHQSLCHCEETSILVIFPIISPFQSNALKSLMLKLVPFLLFSLQVALNVDEHVYALIFGWNTFVALALQSIMTLVVTDERGLDLKIRTQV